MATNTERPDAGAGRPTTTTTRTTATLSDDYSRWVAKWWFTECLTTTRGPINPTDRTGTGTDTGFVCFTKTGPQLDGVTTPVTRLPEEGAGEFGLGGGEFEGGRGRPVDGGGWGRE